MSDPLEDFNANEERLYRLLKKRPICSCCHEHIQDEYFYRIDKKNYCTHCINGFKEYIKDDL